MKIIRLSGCILLGTLFGITTAQVLNFTPDKWWLDITWCLLYMMGLYAFTYTDKR